MSAPAALDREVTPPGRPAGRAFVIGALLVSVAFVGLPAALSYDPWAWLVWGRELVALELETTGGPSWKPLPVLLTALLAPLDELAVPVFAVVVRAGSLLALGATYRLAARLAGPVAGALAAVALVLTPDGDPRFLRLIAESHPGPLSVALVLFAVEAHLDGRHRRSFALTWTLSLLRPEAWPFLALHALWLRRRSHLAPGPLLAALGSVGLLWFGMDWWGSGDPMHGAGTAQVLADVPALERLTDALSMLAGIVPVPIWVGAAVAVVASRRRADPLPTWLAGGALAWSALVIAMAVALGYAAISRFFLPAAGIVCVLGAVGTVQLARRVRGDARRWVAGTAVLAVVLAGATVVPRVAGIAPVLDEVRDRARLEEDLDRVIDRAGGREVLAACGEVAVTASGLLRSSVAWKLDVPLAAVQVDLADGSGGAIVRAGGRGERAVSRRPGAVIVARTAEWVAATINCPSEST